MAGVTLIPDGSSKDALIQNAYAIILMTGRRESWLSEVCLLEVVYVLASSSKSELASPFRIHLILNVANATVVISFVP